MPYSLSSLFFGLTLIATFSLVAENADRTAKKRRHRDAPSFALNQNAGVARKRSPDPKAVISPGPSANDDDKMKIQKDNENPDPGMVRN